MTQVLDSKKTGTIIDARGPRFGAVITTIVLAAALASKSGKIGYIGGVRIPLLQKFEAGFVAGVKATKKSATVDVKYVTEPPE